MEGFAIDTRMQTAVANRGKRPARHTRTVDLPNHSHPDIPTGAILDVPRDNPLPLVPVVTVP